ncbi:hypothetical protein EB061_06840 [bacterium]|jgi:hypothetical protein|nr:hypothetical protein [bacterium]
MKKVMFVFGIVFCALSSPAIADVVRSSTGKGSAKCMLNERDTVVNTVRPSAPVQKPTAEKASQG